MISHERHTFQDQQLIVKDLYYECIGVIPPNHDRTAPSVTLPSDVTISDLDCIILKYILHTPTVKSDIERNLKRVDANIAWSVDSVTLSCTLQKDVLEFSVHARNWRQSVQDSFNEALSRFSHEELSVLQEIWDDFSQYVQVNLSEKFGDDVFLTSDDKGTCTMVVVGKRQSVNDAVEIMKLVSTVSLEPYVVL